jgi:hypothetical protein
MAKKRYIEVEDKGSQRIGNPNAIFAPPPPPTYMLLPYSPRNQGLAARTAARRLTLQTERQEGRKRK